MRKNKKSISKATLFTAIAFSLSSSTYASNESSLFQIKEVSNTNNTYVAHGNCGGCGGQLHEEYLKHQELDMTLLIEKKI